jgi:S1-C subfamily serine protease
MGNGLMKRWPVAAVIGLCFFGGWGDLAKAQSKLNFDEKIAALDSWTVGYNRARSSCLATATYGEETTVWIGLDDGEVYLALTNPNWQSIQEGKQYRIRIASLAGTRWQGNFYGVSRSQEKGIISGGLKENFVKELIQTPGIAVYLESRLIAKLNLDGSPAAFGAVLDCYSSRSSGPSQKAGKTVGKVVSSGTGFIVSLEGHILTNNHVVESCGNVEIERAGQPRVRGTTLARDKANDLAVLKTGLKPENVTSLRTGLRVGENIAVYGFPLSDRLTTTGNFTVGYVSALAGLGDDSSKIQISAPIQPGNSGGPVLDHYGNVVGVIVSTATSAIIAGGKGVAPQNINFAIKANIAKNFLDTNGIRADSPPQTSKTYEFADLAERAKLTTVKILCEQ